MSDECPDCNYVTEAPKREVTPKGHNEPERAELKTTAISVIPIPNGKKIAEFVKRTTDNKNDYYNIIIDRYVELWKLNRVSRDIYVQRMRTGYLHTRISEYLERNYGYVNNLKHGVPRTYYYLAGKIRDKLADIYKLNP